jgi:hypothetical protein
LDFPSGFFWFDKFFIMIFWFDFHTNFNHVNFSWPFNFKILVMKYSKWIGLFIYLCLTAVCFMNWTYHADLGKYFNGFFSQNDVYGKPGKFLIMFSIVCVIAMFIPKIWAKFVHIFFAGFILAYALKTYHLFTSSYNAYTPEKQSGIYLMVLFSVLSFVIALLPDVAIKKVEGSAE